MPSALETARELLEKAEPDYVAVGRVLRTAHQNGENVSRLLTRRKAYYLMAISSAVDDKLIRRQIIRELGWTKSGMIASSVRSKSDADAAIAFARAHTVLALQSFLKSPARPRDLRSKTFSLSPREAEELERALERMGGDRSQALMTIIRTYLPQSGLATEHPQPRLARSRSRRPR